MYKFILFALIAALFPSGCIESKEPERTTIDDAELIMAELPEIMLVRRVTPETQTKRTSIQFEEEHKDIATTSKFGSAGDIAEFNCVIRGLESVIPDIKVVDTENFWSQVAKPGEEEILLPSIFALPYAEKLYDLQIDFIVVVYHKIVEVAEGGAFIGFMALYGYTDREFAAELTVDVATLTALNASNLSGEKGGADIIVFVIPMIFHTRLSSDPCEVIGQISGTAISEHTSAPSPRVLIVASKTNPYDTARKSSWKVASQRRADNREEECSFVFSEAVKLDLVTQISRANSCASFDSRNEWGWSCLAAHNGDGKARFKIGQFYEKGKEPVSQDSVLAYVWYSLAAATGFEETGTNYKKTDSGWKCCFPDVPRREVVAEHLTPDQIAEAERLVAEWEPNAAECEALARTTNEVRISRHKKRADAGDPYAMFEYANSLPLGAGLERLQWYCRAAHAGHARARYQLGRYYQHGWVMERNSAQAYVWYTLSLEVLELSEVARERKRLSESMTLPQIAEAERLVAEWEPNPAKCESSSDASKAP